MDERGGRRVIGGWEDEWVGGWLHVCGREDDWVSGYKGKRLDGWGGGGGLVG